MRVSTCVYSTPSVDVLRRVPIHTQSDRGDDGRTSGRCDVYDTTEIRDAHSRTPGVRVRVAMETLRIRARLTGRTRRVRNVYTGPVRTVPARRSVDGCRHGFS